MTRNALAPLMAEAELQSAILDACGYLGLPVMHINDSRGQKATGYPDLCIADYRAETVRFWELKTERGIVSPNQQEWLAALGACHRVDVRVIRPAWLDQVLEELGRGEATR